MEQGDTVSQREVGLVRTGDFHEARRLCPERISSCSEVVREATRLIGFRETLL